MRYRRSSSFRHRARQRGIVLIVALIVMVATILAAIALISSVDVATLISGNLAFRQSGVQAADSGVEAGRKWLMAPPGSLFNDIDPSYYATWNGGAGGVFDPSTFDWSGKTELTKDAAGNTVAYVVHRMCESPGDPDDLAISANCVKASTVGSGEGNSNRIKEGGEFGCIGTNCSTPVTNPYYRITVKVTGPRSTVTYVQAVIY